MTVAEAQTLCLKQGTPFYSYRLPGERESVFGAQLDGEVAPFRQVGEQGKGFILVPFAESEEVPAWFIRGDITFREVTTDIEIRTGLSGTMGLTDIKPGQEPDISWVISPHIPHTLRISTVCALAPIRSALSHVER